MQHIRCVEKQIQNKPLKPETNKYIKRFCRFPMGYGTRHIHKKADFRRLLSSRPTEFLIEFRDFTSLQAQCPEQTNAHKSKKERNPLHPQNVVTSSAPLYLPSNWNSPISVPSNSNQGFKQKQSIARSSPCPLSGLSRCMTCHGSA